MIARLALVTLLVGCNTTLSFEEQSDSGSDIAPDVVEETAATCVTKGCPLETLHCDSPTGKCVECVQDAECTAYPFERCDLTIHRCVNCVADSDCSLDSKCVLEARRCVETCTLSVECKPAFRCDEARSICVSCASNAQCPPQRHICNPAIGRCDECLADKDCPPFRPKCDPVTFRCASCLSDADCVAPKVCDLSSRSCRAPI